MDTNSFPPPNQQDISSFPPPHQQPHHVAGASTADQEALSLLIPTGQSAWAIAAGYLGLVSLLLWPLGFVAILASWKSLSRARTKATMLRIVTGFVGGGVGVGVTLLFIVSMLGS
jgi:hypothetical protein